MKILKVAKNNGSPWIIVDEIPNILYTKLPNGDFSGEAKCSETGKVVLTDYYLYRVDRYAKAFAGREFTIPMVDGTTTTIKDHWWSGYNIPDDMCSISMNTLKYAQSCYVYFSYNIERGVLNSLLEEYYKNDVDYTYDEVEKWVKTQYDWYPVMFRGVEQDLIVNYVGDIVKKDFSYYNGRTNRHVDTPTGGKLKATVEGMLLYPDGVYRGNRRVSYFEVLRESLPDSYSDEEIIENAKICGYEL